MAADSSSDCCYYNFCSGMEYSLYWPQLQLFLLPLLLQFRSLQRVNSMAAIFHIEIPFIWFNE